MSQPAHWWAEGHAAHEPNPSGSLVIVGSGIKGISQLTLEAISHIEQADKVFYHVEDVATELFIQRHNPRFQDLYELYEEDKELIDMETQMAEVMLDGVRDGQNVVGVFYGHPGVCVNPTHRAVKIARAEGYRVAMLPGVSAEDCLYADLGVNPTQPGCLSLDATTYLERRPLLSMEDHHLILYGVAPFGNLETLETESIVSRLATLLQDYLGEDHPVVHYVAPCYFFVRPFIEQYVIRDLHREEILRRITSVSMLYIPPRLNRQPLPHFDPNLDVTLPPYYVGPSLPGISDQKPYDRKERLAVAALSKRKISSSYQVTRASDAMYELLHSLAVDPREAALYIADPAKYIRNTPGLYPAEADAMSRHGGRGLTAAVKKPWLDVAARFILATLRSSTLALRFAAVLLGNIDNENGEANIANWLRSRGYDTTCGAVSDAYQEMGENCIDVYESLYSTYLGGKQGPMLLIQDGQVSVDGNVIQNWTFQNGTLTWKASDGNSSNAVTHLQVVTERKAASRGSYFDPEFFGLYWAAGSPKPTYTNFFGNRGTPPITEAGGSSSTLISAFCDKYQTYLADASGEYQADDTLVFAALGGETTVTYRGEPIRKFQYGNETLSWDDFNGNATSAIITFHAIPAPTPTTPIPGSRFTGRLWASGAPEPSDFNFSGAAHSTDPGQIVVQYPQPDLATNIFRISTAALLFLAAMIKVYLLVQQRRKDPSEDTESAEETAQYESRRLAGLLAQVIRAAAPRQGEQFELSERPQGQTEGSSASQVPPGHPLRPPEPPTPQVQVGAAPPASHDTPADESPPRQPPAPPVETSTASPAVPPAPREEGAEPSPVSEPAEFAGCA